MDRLKLKLHRLEFLFSQKSIFLLGLILASTNRYPHYTYILFYWLCQMDRHADNAMCAVCAPSANATQYPGTHWIFFFIVNSIHVSYYRRNPFDWTVYTHALHHLRFDSGIATKTSHTLAFHTLVLGAGHVIKMENNNLSKTFFFLRIINIIRCMKNDTYEFLDGPTESYSIPTRKFIAF